MPAVPWEIFRNLTGFNDAANKPDLLSHGAWPGHGVKIGDFRLFPVFPGTCNRHNAVEPPNHTEFGLTVPIQTARQNKPFLNVRRAVMMFDAFFRSHRSEVASSKAAPSIGRRLPRLPYSAHGQRQTSQRELWHLFRYSLWSGNRPQRGRHRLQQLPVQPLALRP